MIPYVYTLGVSQTHSELCSLVQFISNSTPSVCRPKTRNTIYCFRYQTQVLI